MQTILDVARSYVRAGLGVIPVRADGSKAPALRTWEEYQERVPTDDELSAWFAPGRPVGIGVVCGVVSGNLAVLDFETADVWDKWLAAVTASPLAAYLPACPVVKTPSGGRHVYCRIAEGWVAGGPLARRPKGTAGKGIKSEVRGQGHYVVAPGSPMACHPSNRPYTFEAPGWLANVID